MEQTKTCTCVTDFENRIVKEQPMKGLKITKAEVMTTFWFGLQVFSRPEIKIELTVEGKKKPKVIQAQYSHCPFCGQKYPEKED